MRTRPSPLRHAGHDTAPLGDVVDSPDSQFPHGGKQNTTSTKLQPRLPPRVSLLGLPRELRDIIIDFVSQQEDLTAVAQTSRQLRAEVFSRLPGSARIDYNAAVHRHSSAALHALVHQHVEIKDVDCTEDYPCRHKRFCSCRRRPNPPEVGCVTYFRVEVVWRFKEEESTTTTRTTAAAAERDRWSTSRWVIRGADSPMARYMYLYYDSYEVYSLACLHSCYGDTARTAGAYQAHSRRPVALVY
ncbi:hypothetical protein GE09DRAFT_1059246 [Coniochaeta sp. 2T2.1]|nr:hypothetical protein GE09DRAFT_1059246 [Coniochaeta sp. 2T2.1]